MSASRVGVSVFCAYASRDEVYRQQLESHLSGLRRQGLIALVTDREIVPGTNRVEVIDAYLSTASVILLLISADFVASDYWDSMGMKRALERHGADEARIVPIVVRPCDWEHLAVGRLQVLPVDGRAVSLWGNVDEAWTQVVAGLRRVIEDVSLLSGSVARSALPAVWMIPYARNPFFLGRDELLEQIHSQLWAGEVMALSQPQAISGLGGIGKTQMAVEYAYRYAHEYEVVLWAQAESIETLNAAYAQIAVKLDLREKGEERQEVIVGAVKRWLQGHRQWLLILDNADELMNVDGFLPVVVEGHVLITTRAGSTGQLARRIEVQTFTEERGAVFLLRRAGRLSPDAALAGAKESDQVLAREIARELGGLPLALDQAGAYLEQTGYSLEDYRQIYQRHRTSLLKERGGLVRDHPEPVAVTWLLAFERVRERSTVAVEVLRLCAYLAADGIPLALMTERKGAIMQDLFVLGKAIETLCAYSLVSHDAATRTLSVHRLVQVVVRDALSEEEQGVWMQRAVQRVKATFPTPWEVSEWDECERWLPHVFVCSVWIEQAHMEFSGVGTLLYRAGLYVYKRARYAEAERLYERALAIRERRLGPNHPDVAFLLNNLANLYRERGKYEEAEGLYERALAIRERRLGPNHPDVAFSLNGMANLYREQGKYEEAERLYERALAIREQQLGLNHHRMAQPLNNLANLYREQGKYEEAERLYERALTIREQKLGADHPDVASLINNLAHLYRVKGKYEEAERLYERALTIREQWLGAKHPDVAFSLDGMAELYREQGKYIEVERLYERALDIKEQRLGPNHHKVASSLNGMANLYRVKGEYEEAERLYERALTIREQKLGPDHPDVASSLSGMADLYREQGKHVEAEELYQRALSVREQRLGADHRLTQLVRSNYVSLLREMGRDEDARRVLGDS